MGTRRRVRLQSVLVGSLALALFGCAERPSDGNAVAVNGAPFAGLSPCSDAPFVGFVGGVTAEGELLHQPGSSPSGDIYGIRPDGSLARVTTDLGSYRFDVSADGRTVFASPALRMLGPEATSVAADPSSDEIVAIDARSGRQSVVVEAPGLAEVAVAPDGHHLAVITQYQGGVTSRYSRIALVRLETGELLRPPGFDPLAEQVDRFLAWRPDGRQLAYVAATLTTDDVRVLDPETGAERVVHRSEESLFGLNWSPDGRRLSTTGTTLLDAESAAQRGGLEIDVDTGAVRMVIEDDVPSGQVYTAADGSAVTSVDPPAAGPVLARTWTRGDGDEFGLTSSAPIGADQGLVSAGGLVVPRCALDR